MNDVVILKIALCHHAMAAQRESHFSIHGHEICNGDVVVFESTSQSNLSSLSHPSLASTSTMEDLDGQSRETVMTNGDSGFSEMELTSPSSENTSPEFETSCFSSMEVHEEDNDDDISSTISDLSGVSDLSGQDWKPAVGPMGWIQRQMHMGADPRHLLGKIVPDSEALFSIPSDISDIMLWKLIVNLLVEYPVRKKLPDVNTLEDVVGLIRRCSRILVLTGAGVSVSCGIPDFRSPRGVYARLARDFPDLPDPHAMFDIKYFNRDPRPFYKFAREIYPGQFQPSPCHKFIRALETHGKLLRNYTQNIDTLEQVAGIERVVQCHGSFATATCTNCQRKVSAEEIRDDILSQKIPVCNICVPDAEQVLQDPLAYSSLVARGVMKPDIVFFGEGLPEDFHEAMARDRDEADLLLIIGSSLKVQPVALIPSSVPVEVPQVLINREPLPECQVDVELLGDADVLVDHLCRMLGEDWTELCWRESPLTQAVDLVSEDVAYSTKQEEQPCSPELNPRKRPAPTTAPTEESPKRPKTEEGEPEQQQQEEEGPADDQMTNSEWDARHIKLRQMSSDSTRDSGIAEPQEDRPPLSLSARLPENSYYVIAPNRHIFPGAEVYPSKSKRRLSTDSDLEMTSQDSDAADAATEPEPLPTTSQESPSPSPMPLPAD